METRGALILVPHPPPDGAGAPVSPAFGECDLLALTVREVGGAVPHIVVIPGAVELSARYRKAFLRGVRVTPASRKIRPEAEAFGEAEPLLPGEVTEVLRVTADLPYLDRGRIEKMFEALVAGIDAVTVVAGGRGFSVPAVHRRGLAAPAADASHLARRALLPLEPVGPRGSTAATRLDSPQAYRLALAHHGLCDPARPAITLELYGNLRIKTGCETLPIFSATVGEAFQVLRRIQPAVHALLPEPGQLAEHFRFSINGAEVTTELGHPLKENDHLILFSATVGG